VTLARVHEKHAQNHYILFIHACITGLVLVP